MSFEALFSLASTAALAGWAALILLPRWGWLDHVLRFGLIGLLCLAYAVLAFVYFFRVEGGGFNSIAEVRGCSPPIRCCWPAGSIISPSISSSASGSPAAADKAGISRFLQAPILILTFMFGPAGLLAFYLTRGTALFPTLSTRS